MRMRVHLAVLIAVLAVAGCTSTGTGAATADATTIGETQYRPPPSFTLDNETDLSSLWEASERGVTLYILLIPNPQSESDILENFVDPQWAPEAYLDTNPMTNDSWFQPTDRTDITEMSFDGRRWLTMNVTGQQDVLLSAHLTAGRSYIYQFLLFGKRDDVTHVYPPFRDSLARANFTD